MVESDNSDTFETWGPSKGVSANNDISTNSHKNVVPDELPMSIEDEDKNP